VIDKDTINADADNLGAFVSIDEGKRRANLMAGRDSVGTHREMCNLYAPKYIPSFSKDGYYLTEMPKELHKEL